MAQLTVNQVRYQCNADETVLDALTRSGVAVPYSCRNGICQTCVMQSSSANVPITAQNGLKPTLQAQNYFMACVCYPTEDMTITLPDNADRLLSATVTAVRQLNDDIKCVGLDCPSLQNYHAGQFINLYQDNDNTRSYSLASVPTDPYLRLHVRRMPDGRVSNWIHNELKVGDRVQISAPVGACFYVPDTPQQPLLLIGTGSGLAPLMGIIRDALNHRHFGDIYLYHGSHDVTGLYLVNELCEMTVHYSNFHYVPCVSSTNIDNRYQAGRAMDVAFVAHPHLAGWRIFLCGNPNMVTSARKKAYLAGAKMNDIYADAYLINHKR
ncbi:MAG: 2Fe-2S iron-sulfur cluster binding domain-containing protein [Sulfuriferula sp.]|nr:2Fe-2S iron-sulfur cluster binding domain-containing protein [Sulfuriferula sp.]